MTVEEHRAARRLAPALVAAALAATYVIAAPDSRDLAAQLFRVRLFQTAGFTLWNNWWYAGHPTLGYSVLFPPLAALITPRALAALATVGAAATFAALARHRTVPTLWFAAATVTPLLSGRLTFAAGLLPALLAVLAIDRRRAAAATLAATVAALTSPVAALLPALAAAATAITDRTRRTAAVAALVASLAPIAVLAILFPTAGREPFATSAYIPMLIVAIALAGLAHDRTATAAALGYAALLTLAYIVPTPLGGNAARIGALFAGPLAALALERPSALLVIAIPLVYLQTHAAITDVITDDPSTRAAYYAPLLRYLHHQPGGPFRIEVPFTDSHWEAYELTAPPDPIALARGWERQLDIAGNPLFYRAHLTATEYDRWLHADAVRFVALPDAALDPSGRAEAALIRAVPAFLTAVAELPHWRVYVVTDPTPIVTGAATLTGLTAGAITLDATRAGVAEIRVRSSPYWALDGSAGCVTQRGGFIEARFAGPGRVMLVQRFDPLRAMDTLPRCASSRTAGATSRGSSASS